MFALKISDNSLMEEYKKYFKIGIEIYGYSEIS